MADDNNDRVGKPMLELSGLLIDHPEVEDIPYSPSPVLVVLEMHLDPDRPLNAYAPRGETRGTLVIRTNLDLEAMAMSVLPPEEDYTCGLNQASLLFSTWFSFIQNGNLIVKTSISDIEKEA